MSEKELSSHTPVSRTTPALYDIIGNTILGSTPAQAFASNSSPTPSEHKESQTARRELISRRSRFSKKNNHFRTDRPVLGKSDDDIRCAQRLGKPAVPLFGIGESRSKIAKCTERTSRFRRRPRFRLSSATSLKDPLLETQAKIWPSQNNRSRRTNAPTARLARNLDTRSSLSHYDSIGWQTCNLHHGPKAKGAGLGTSTSFGTFAYGHQSVTVRSP